jgi:biotin carboxyl carrier protein
MNEQLLLSLPLETSFDVGDFYVETSNRDAFTWMKSWMQWPMPGLVIKILAEQGKHYKAGDALMILEAMKMENVFKAAADVTIKAIEITERQTVEKGQILMVFE